MNKRTLQALKDSIKKWDLIAKGEMADMGGENCMLCAEFAKPVVYSGESCTKCPVYELVGDNHCQKTPYIKWIQIQLNLRGYTPDGYVADRPELVQLAKDERDFLRSLLPKKK